MPRSWQVSSQGTNGVNIGMRNTARGWSVDDRTVVSYCHLGSQRTVYAVPPSHRHEMDDLINRMLSSSAGIDSGEMWKCRACLLDPAVLRRHKIPYNQVVQGPGEFLIFAPGTFTSSVCHGMTCWEDVAVRVGSNGSSVKGRANELAQLAEVAAEAQSHTSMNRPGLKNGGSMMHAEPATRPRGRGQRTKADAGREASMHAPSGRAQRLGIKMEAQGSGAAGTMTGGGIGAALHNDVAHVDAHGGSGRGIRRKRKRRDDDSSMGESAGGALRKDADKNKNCHFCEHAPKRCSIFTCTGSICDQMFCENCCKRHLGRPTHFKTQLDADNCDWRCPICTRACCCTQDLCTKDHLHCKRYRRKIKFTAKRGGTMKVQSPERRSMSRDVAVAKKEQEEESGSEGEEREEEEEEEEAEEDAEEEESSELRKGEISALSAFAGQMMTPQSPLNEVGTPGSWNFSASLPMQLGNGMMMPAYQLMQMQVPIQQITGQMPGGQQGSQQQQQQQQQGSQQQQQQRRSRMEALAPFLAPGAIGPPGFGSRQSSSNNLMAGISGGSISVANTPGAFGLGAATPLTPLGEMLGVATPYSFSQDGDSDSNQPARCSWFDHLFGGNIAEGQAAAAAVMQSHVVEQLQAQALLPGMQAAQTQHLLQQWAIQQQQQQQVQQHQQQQGVGGGGSGTGQQGQQGQGNASILQKLKPGSGSRDRQGTLEDTTTSWAPDEFVFSEEEEEDAR